MIHGSAAQLTHMSVDIEWNVEKESRLLAMLPLIGMKDSLIMIEYNERKEGRQGKRGMKDMNAHVK
jgi:hypothetical protein